MAGARARARRLAEGAAAWGALASLYEEAAAGNLGLDAAAVLLREAAELHRLAGAVAEAERDYRRVLGIQPDDVDSRERLESLYADHGRWRELAAALEERLDARLGAALPAAERRVYLRKLADVYQGELHNPREAAAALDRLCGSGQPEANDLERLASLLEQLGRWGAATSALEKLAERDRGTPRARAARRRVAEICERELELSDRAEEAYRILLREFPDDRQACAALAELLERRQRWSALEEVLRRLIGLTEEAETRVELLRRRARILMEFLAKPSEATALLRQAQQLSPARQSLTNELTSVLRRSGQPLKALALLEAQARWHEELGSPPRQLAAILLQIAALCSEQLDDPRRARRALQQLLERIPDHAPALSALAALEQHADPRAYAQARLREADAVDDPGARVRALVDAGVALRDRVGDADGARRALERAVELAPANAEAVTALAQLYADAGDIGAAESLLGGLVDTVPNVASRGQILTQLAELALTRGAANRGTAERRLLQALEERADDVPALRLLADLLAEDGRQDDLVQLLEARLPALGDKPPAIRAEMERRLGEALDALGRSQQAYERLKSADLLARNDLLTKIAIGENCFRAKRWREAGLHLGAVRDHPDAPRHAARAAVALAHAAVAETRGLRADRAPSLYEAALALDPDCLPAVRGLADIELERGHLARAAQLYERQAAATPEPERRRRFEALGDLLVERLDDPDRAARAYAQAVGSLAQLDRGHRPLLDKLLACQRRTGDWSGAGSTLELLASLAEHWDRTSLFGQAAEAHRTGRDPARARSAAEAAVAVDALDEAAVALASELQVEAADWEAARSLLARALHTWEAIDRGDSAPITLYRPLAPEDRPRLALRTILWARLGDARRQRGDARGALAAYQRAVELSPDEAGAVPARRAMIPLLGSDPASAELAREHLLAVVRADPTPGGLLQLASRSRTGARIERSVEDDGAIELEFSYDEDPRQMVRRRWFLELAAAIGAALGDEDREFLDLHPRGPSSGRVYRESLRAEDSAALVADADDQPLMEILGLLSQAAALLWPKPAMILEALGHRDARPIPARAGRGAEIYGQVARALGAPGAVAYVVDDPAAPDIAVACSFPPLVIFGPRLVDIGTRVSLAEQRFVLGRAAELVRPARLPAVGLPPGRFELLLAALDRGLSSRHPPGGDGDQASLERETGRLMSALSLPLRAQIAGILARSPGTRLDAARFRAACHRAADRAGLLLTDDVATAIRLASRQGDAGHLVAFAVTEACFEARIKLGLA